MNWWTYMVMVLGVQVLLLMIFKRSSWLFSKEERPLRLRPTLSRVISFTSPAVAPIFTPSLTRRSSHLIHCHPSPSSSSAEEEEDHDEHNASPSITSSQLQVFFIPVSIHFTGLIPKTGGFPNNIIFTHNILLGRERNGSYMVFFCCFIIIYICSCMQCKKVSVWLICFNYKYSKICMISAYSPPDTT